MRTDCSSKLGLCRCWKAGAHTDRHLCRCGCMWRTGDAGVQITPKPVRPAVRS